jgi:lysozyme family protein
MSEPGTTPTPPTEADLATEERALKQEEFAARREEARVKLAATTAPSWRSADPLVLAVVAGIFTLAGNTYLAYYNARATRDQEAIKATNALKQEETKAKNDLDLEREKAKASLILQAVSTNDPAAARRNLLFFLDGGLIKDDDNKIHAALDKYSPVLPSASGQPSRPPPTTPESYNDAFWSANLRPEWIAQLDHDLSLVTAAKPRLERVAQAAHTPWYVIGLFWFLETGGDFTKHLHNGDPLTGPTVHVPAGRGWPPPPGVDAWEYSATDAVAYYHLNNLEGLQVGEILARLERANGTGYQRRGYFSPYLWSGTDLYEKGRYVADGRFDPEAISRQPGAAALLRRLQDRKVIDLRGVASASAPPSQDVKQ